MAIAKFPVDWWHERWNKYWVSVSLSSIEKLEVPAGHGTYLGTCLRCGRIIRFTHLVYYNDRTQGSNVFWICSYCASLWCEDTKSLPELSEEESAWLSLTG